MTKQRSSFLNVLGRASFHFLRLVQHIGIFLSLKLYRVYCDMILFFVLSDLNEALKKLSLNTSESGKPGLS